MGSVRLQNPAHPAALLARANEMRTLGVLCDVVVCVDGREFRAHRTVLAAASKMFQILFQRPRPTYTLDFLTHTTFSQILDYAYTASLNTHTRELDDLLYAAEILEMEYLEEQCLRMLEALQREEEEEEKRGRDEEEKKRKRAGRGEVEQVKRGREEEEERKRVGRREEEEEILETIQRVEEGQEEKRRESSGEEEYKKTKRRRGEEENDERMGEEEEEKRKRGRGGEEGQGELKGSRNDSRSKTSENSTGLTSLTGPAPNPYFSQSLWRGLSPSRELTEHLNQVASLYSNPHSITVTPPLRRTEAEPSQEVEAGDGVLGHHDNEEEDEGPPSRGSVITSAHHHSSSANDEERVGLTDSESLSGLMGVASLYNMAAMTPPLHVQLELGRYSGLLGPNHLGFPLRPRDLLSSLVGGAKERAGLFNCDARGAEGPDYNSLEQHRRLQQEVAGSYVCDVCGKTFLDSLRLRMHMLSHTGEKGVVCEQCGSQFQTEEELEMHKQTHTGCDIAVFCLLCGKRFRTRSSLRQHTESHAGLKSYTCSHCHLTYPSNTALKRHLRTHTGEHPFECEFCGSCFRDDGTLRSHKRTHTGEKPYQCNSCSKTFSLKHQLETHYRVHTGEKPFECKLCHQRSRDYSAMIKHLRTHNGASPYQCTLCHLYCPSLSAMTKHVKNTHTHHLPPDWSIENTYLYLCYV